MRIGVVGHSGMLGNAVMSAIEKRSYTAIALSSDSWPFFADVVINCAGIVKGRPEVSSANMVNSNSLLPHILSERCTRYKSRFIHVSTDCVFSYNGPHDEFSITQPHDLYARSKLAGEVYDSPHLTIRTSFIGHGKRGLIAELQSVSTYYASRLQLWTGHTINTIADLLITLADRDDITGLLHIPGEVQSRYDLCERIKHKFSLPVEIIENNTYMADRRLESRRWESLSMPQLPPFLRQLQEMGDV